MVALTATTMKQSDIIHALNSMFGRELVQKRRLPVFARTSTHVLGLLIVGLLVAVIPGLYNVPLSSISAVGLAPDNVLHTWLATIAASISGYFFIVQVNAYPGTATTANILPGMMTSYGLLIVIMFLLRVDYSRYVIFANFILSSVWLFAILAYNDSHRIPVLGLVPGGNHRDVADLANAKWKPLSASAETARNVDGVVADLHADMPAEWEAFIARCIISGIPVYDIKHIRESLTGQVELEHLSENSFGAVLPSSFYIRVKRVVDMITALLFAPLFLLVIGITAIIVRLDSPGPAIYKQVRYGYRAKPFIMYKIRSMRMNADKEQAFTGSADDRVTRVGRFIRKFRIDEFPQILNILRGEMSWIGPRPESLDLASQYIHDIPFYFYRYAVRPGLSGWAQVNQGNVGDVHDEAIKLRYDFYYAKHFSLWLDLLIVQRTIITMATGFGSR